MLHFPEFFECISSTASDPTVEKIDSLWYAYT